MVQAPGYPHRRAEDAGAELAQARPAGVVRVPRHPVAGDRGTNDDAQARLSARPTG